MISMYEKPIPALNSPLFLQVISYGGYLKFVLVYRPGQDASPSELDGPLVELIVSLHDGLKIFFFLFLISIY